MDNNKKALTIRFDMGKPHDKYVWNHLHNDKMSYHTMNHAVIEQLYEHFNRKDAKETEDLYNSTEDAYIDYVMKEAEDILEKVI